MRDEKEERKKQARSNKQTRQSNTAHPRHVHVHVLCYNSHTFTQFNPIPTIWFQFGHRNHISNILTPSVLHVYMVQFGHIFKQFSPIATIYGSVWSQKPHFQIDQCFSFSPIAVHCTHRYMYMLYIYCICTSKKKAYCSFFCKVHISLTA